MVGRSTREEFGRKELSQGCTRPRVDLLCQQATIRQRQRMLDIELFPPNEQHAMNVFKEKEEKYWIRSP